MVIDSVAHYIRIAYRVLPLEPGSKKPLSRLVPRGLKDASDSPEVVEAWAKAAPGCNWGLLPPADVLVLDVDAPERWPELLQEFPELAEAPRQRTPRGGVHVFLRVPDTVGELLSASTRALPGCDIRGLGRAYLVVAPSVVNGRPYVWERPLLPPEELPEAPPALIARLLPPPPAPPAPKPVPAPVGTNGDRLRRRLAGLLSWACEEVERAPVGTRHTTLLNYARLVGGWLHHGLDEREALEALAGAAMRAGLPEREAYRTARDGLEYGKHAPLDLPPEAPQPEQHQLVAAAEASGEENRRSTTSDELIKLAEARAEFWRDPEGTGWATLKMDDHVEHWPVKSRAFRLWLIRLYYEKHGRPPNSQALQDALGVLEARALFSGVEHPVFLRVAHYAGALWLDLGRDDWLAVRVDASGWCVTTPEPRFRRSKATRPLPIPEPGDIGDLFAVLESWDLDESQRALVVAWLLGTLSPGPYPVLVLSGEQGSGKSTLARALQRLIDPGDVASLPRDTRELYVTAKHHYILSFDNVSSLPPWLSDDLCKLSTGGELRTRELYTDDQEVVFYALRPVILNGITDFVTRQDLLDRAIVLHLPRLEFYEPETDLWERFNQLHPRALGALLSLASLALRELPRTKAPAHVRMADFARWALAAESGYAAPGTFVTAFSEMRIDSVRLALEAEPLYPYLIRLLEKEPRVEGTASELLQKLNELRGEGRPPDGWPRVPHALAQALKRMAPGLRQVGINVAPLPRSKHKRGWVVEKVGESSVTCVTQTDKHRPERWETMERRGDAPESGMRHPAVIGDAWVSPGDATLKKASPCKHCSEAAGDAGDAGDAPTPPFIYEEDWGDDLPF